MRRRDAFGTLRTGIIALLVLGSVLLSGCATRSDDAARKDSGPVRINFSTVTPLHHAHAHNDYLHLHPLYDALSNGFNSVEADIWLIGGRLLVAHNRFATKPDRTLESLYLDPLEKIVEAGGGGVYGPGTRITLLVDVKSDADPTYRELDRTLARYRNILTSFRGSVVNEGPVTVIVSGNRDLTLMESQPLRYAAYDGRIPDLGSANPPALIPLISDRWGAYFSWSGLGTMPDVQLARLRSIVERAHAEGRKVRFWGTPDAPGQARERVWQTLLSNGVDYLNTDHLADLRAFLLRGRDR